MPTLARVVKIAAVGAVGVLVAGLLAGQVREDDRTGGSDVYKTSAPHIMGTPPEVREQQFREAMAAFRSGSLSGNWLVMPGAIPLTLTHTGTTFTWASRDGSEKGSGTVDPAVQDENGKHVSAAVSGKSGSHTVTGSFVGQVSSDGQPMRIEWSDGRTFERVRR